MKASHLEKIGASSAPMRERCSFFGEPDANARAAHAAKQQSAPAFVADDADDVNAHVCTSNLQFARQNASATGPKNSHGIVGAVCRHGTPLRGCFVDMPAPEQFCYYFFMLIYLLRRRPDLLLGFFYVDIGCRLLGSWQTWVARCVASGEADPAWAGLRIVVPWMHAAGHNLACQLACSAFFQVSC
jgi:hypothetical protein